MPFSITDLPVLCVLGGIVGTSHAYSQGLYVLQPLTGAIELVNYTSNTRTPVGTGIAHFGWHVPLDCSPTTIDTTGKWMYVMARVADDSPWSVISMELRDGSIRKVYELPPSFPPSLCACDHSIAEDGDWHAYVSAVTNAGAEPRLVVWRFTFTWPDSNETVPVLDTTLASLGMGSALPVAISVVTDFTVWLGLTAGFVGVDLATNNASRRLAIAAGTTWSRPSYSTVGAVRRTYAISTSASNSTAIVSFVDDGSGTPAVQSTATAKPAPPDGAGFVALLDDRSAIAEISDGAIVTFGLDGSLQSAVQACVNDTCPIALAYEPFVF